MTYGDPGLKRRLGPTAPQMTDAVEKVVDPGHMKPCGCLGVQISSILLSIHSWIKVTQMEPTMVAMTWIVNIMRGGIFM